MHRGRRARSTTSASGNDGGPNAPIGGSLARLQRIHGPLQRDRSQSSRRLQQSASLLQGRLSFRYSVSMDQLDAELLVICLRYWWGQGEPLVWGGGEPPNRPRHRDQGRHGPSVKWWCLHLGLSAQGEQVAPLPVDYGAPHGYPVTTAYQEAEGAGQILSALCGGRRWFVLHPDVDGDAYAAALQLMGQRGWAVPPGWP